MNDEKIINEFIELSNRFYMLKGMAPSKPEYRSIICTYPEWYVTMKLIDQIVQQHGNQNPLLTKSILTLFGGSFSFQSGVLSQLILAFLIKEGVTTPNIKSHVKAVNEILNKGEISIDEKENVAGVVKILEFIGHNQGGFKGKPISARKAKKIIDKK